jgi:hypothetical protein
MSRTPELPTLVVEPLPIWMLALVGVVLVPMERLPAPVTSSAVVACGRAVGL